MQIFIKKVPKLDWNSLPLAETTEDFTLDQQNKILIWWYWIQSTLFVE